MGLVKIHMPRPASKRPHPDHQREDEVGIRYTTETYEGKRLVYVRRRAVLYA